MFAHSRPFGVGIFCLYIIVHACMGQGMAFIVVKDTKSMICYLGFDANGYHKWTKHRLDAIRFESTAEIEQTCHLFLAAGARIKECDGDGHYQFYAEHEIQTFKEDATWMFRFCPIQYRGEYTYSDRRGYKTQPLAIAAAKARVDKDGRKVMRLRYFPI